MPYIGFAPLAAELVAADVEADHELLALHAARLGHQEVAQLMDEDHRAQADARPSESRRPASERQISPTSSIAIKHIPNVLPPRRAQRSSSIKSLERGIGFEMM